MYGVALCGWTVGVYIIQLLWENVQTIFMHYQNYVFWYIFITGFVSFICKYSLFFLYNYYMKVVFSVLSLGSSNKPTNKKFN